jgi:uncharacterized protein YjbI with pentapeptide repeats
MTADARPTPTHRPRRQASARPARPIVGLVALVCALAVVAAACSHSDSAAPPRKGATPTRNAAGDALGPSPQQAVRDRIAAAEKDAKAEPGPAFQGFPPEVKMPYSSETTPSVCSTIETVTSADQAPDGTVVLKHDGDTTFPMIRESSFAILDCPALLAWLTKRDGRFQVVAGKGTVLRCARGTEATYFGPKGGDPDTRTCYYDPEAITPGAPRITWDITSMWGSVAKYHECGWCDFSGLELGSVSFQGSHLRDSTFEGTKLTGGNFNQATIDRTSFDGALLNGTLMNQTTISDTSFAGTTLRDVQLSLGTLDGVRFTKKDKPARLVRVTLPARMDDVAFDDAQLVDVTLSMGSMDNAASGLWGCTSFRNVVLSGQEPFAVREDRASTWPAVDRTHHLDGSAASGACDSPYRGAVLDVVQVSHLGGADLSGSAVVVPPGATDLVDAPLANTVLTDMLFVGPTPNFSGADLRNAVLDGLDLSNARFAGTSVPGLPEETLPQRPGVVTKVAVAPKPAQPANLSGASLQATTLTSAWMPAVNFDGANLSGADLTDASLSDTSFTDTTGSGAHGTVSFARADLAGANFTGFHGDDVTFSKAHIVPSGARPASFDGAGLTSAHFDGAIIGKVSFDKATLTGADMSRSLCVACTFSSVRVDRLKLIGSKQLGSTWKDLANTAGADLTGTDFVGGSGTYTLPLPLTEVPAQITYSNVTVSPEVWTDAQKCPNGKPVTKATAPGCTGKMAVDEVPVIPTCTSAGPFRCPGTIAPWPTDAGSTPIDAAQSRTDSGRWVVATADNAGSLLVMDGKNPRWVTVPGLQAPTAIAALADGSYAVADGKGHQVLRVVVQGSGQTPPTATSSVLAGTATAGDTGDGGPATEATFDAPSGVWVDPEGIVYVSDSGTGRIRRILTNGIVEPVAKGGGMTAPAGLAGDANGFLYVADRSAHQVFRVTLDGSVTPFAGSGAADGDRCAAGGCDALKVALGDPTDVVVLDVASAPASRPTGTPTILIADRTGRVVQAVDADGTVVPRFAGTGESGAIDASGPAADTPLAGPIGLAVDSVSRRVYVADQSSSGAAFRFITLP